MSILNKKLLKETDRILTLGDVNNENALYIISEILEINKFDEKKKHKEPIELILSSCGGLVYDGFGIIDAIKNSITPIHITCYGLAMSMALPILVSGHYRKMSQNSTLMYHEIAWDTGYEKLTNHKFGVKEGERLIKMFDNTIVDNTNITQRKLNEVKKQQKEWYINSDEALKLGIIDEII